MPRKKGADTPSSPVKSKTPSKKTKSSTKATKASTKKPTKSKSPKIESKNLRTKSPTKPPTKSPTKSPKSKSPGRPTRKRANDASTNGTTKKQKSLDPLATVKKEIETVAKAPDKYFINAGSTVTEKFSVLTKTLFDFSKKAEQTLTSGVQGGPLPELLVEGFDVEQIWQQLEVQNDSIVRSLSISLDELIQNNDEDEDEDEDDVNEDEDEDEDEGEDRDNFDDFDNDDFGDEDMADMGMFDDEGDEGDFDGIGDSDDEGAQPNGKKTRKLGPLVLEEEEDEGDEELSDYLDNQPNKRKKHQNENEDEDEDNEEDDDNENDDRPKTELDDEFFSFSEMEKFADDETSIFTGGAEDDQIDFLDGQVQEFGRTAGYADFFDDAGPRNEEKNRGDLDESESEQEEELMSAFEQRTAQMKKQITELEGEIIKPRPWNLSGEVDAGKRPEESLLETDLDFEHATKPTEDITEETTSALEALIKQRIMDEAWDDVERKEPPKEKEYTPVDEVSTDKNKLGLADIYEKEFLDLAKDEGEQTEAQAKLSKEHQEIAAIFAKLSYKLDSLADFTFTPKPPKQDVVISSHTPAIQMEEVIPMGVSSAQLIAPQEEWKGRVKGQMAGESEVTSEEKKSKRSKKKRIRRRTLKEREKKMGTQARETKDIKEALNQRGVSTGKMSDGTKYGTSKEVFQKLTNDLSKVTGNTPKKEASTSELSSAKSLKL